MRWPHESAIARRDDQLAAIRRLSIWIAGGATAASLGLAAALGFALPGHTATAPTARQPGQSGGGSRHGGEPGRAAGHGTGSGAAGQGTGLASPPQGPVNSGAPPAVSSGGS
jgi:hypothetical protein